MTKKPQPRRRSRSAPAREAPAERNARLPNRAALAGRLWRAAERQVGAIERRLALSERKPHDQERDARMLAALVKTLRELAALDAAAQRAAMADDDNDDDEVPRDIEEFRRELARRMEAIVAERTRAVRGEPDGA